MSKFNLADAAFAVLLATGVLAQTAPDSAHDVPTATANEKGATAAPEATDGDGTDPMGTDTASPALGSALEGGWAPVDLASVSSEDLIGSDIVNQEDETIAAIDDVVIADDGRVESLVARFGGFFGFGSERVLLTLDEVEIVKDGDDNVMVRTNLTPETIGSRPDYEG